MPYKVKKLTPIDTSSLPALGKSVTDLSKYTEDEFASLARALQATEPVQILHVQPPKRQPGLMVYADGTNWNPGAGEGPYFYNQAGQWVPEFFTPAESTLLSSKIQTVKQQHFTAGGTYTPSAGMVYCIIECVGGGGGGGGAVGAAGFALGGGGGGSGGYIRLVTSAAVIGASQIVTVGLGGAGGVGVASTPAGNGGTTSVGSVCSVAGGGGGMSGSSAQVGAGGAGGASGTGYSILGVGNIGGWGTYYSSSNACAFGGNGAGSFFGGGGSMGAAGSGGSAPGAAASGYGGGGGGASSCNAAGLNPGGGAGMSGVVFVTEFCTQ